MAPKKSQGPSSFCEWVVGTSIPSALGPLPRKPPTRRDIVRVEISTDDESETDSLKITYPRSQSKAKHTATAVKKVRFEGMPPKSVLKKTATIITSDSDPETSESSSEVTTEEATSEEDEESDEPPISKSKKKKKQQHNVENDEDSEPHPTCKCVQCISGRMKLRKRDKAFAKQKREGKEESSDSEADIPCKAKPQKKGKRGQKKEESEDDEDETSTSAAKSDSEPPQKKKNENQEGEGKKAKGKNKQSEEDSAEEAKPAKDRKGQKNESKSNKAEAAASKNKNQQKDGQKKGNYPEALPLPHTRRPHYIEPVRAEVVQTERVMETPQDPPPNAFYDAEHNIIRVYHGPVWGGNPNQALYPRRDNADKPLPMGMPHPSQNPYLHGFNNQPNAPQPGFENVPVTQGMPMNTWNAMMPPPPGYPPFNYPQNDDQEVRMNRGAFSKMPYPNNKDASSSKGKDKTGANNVGPGSIKSGQDNPYYQMAKSSPQRSQKSQFSAWGENRTASHGSRQTGGDNKWGDNKWPDGAGSTGGNSNSNKFDGNNNGGWDNVENKGWDNSNNTNDQQNGTNTWNGNNNNQNVWPDSTNSNNNGGWDNTNNNPQWNNAPDSGQTSGFTGDNNVAPVETMPGAWEKVGETPGWADTTMAASTGGAVDYGQGNQDNVAW